MMLLKGAKQPGNERERKMVTQEKKQITSAGSKHCESKGEMEAKKGKENDSNLPDLCVPVPPWLRRIHLLGIHFHPYRIRVSSHSSHTPRSPRGTLLLLDTGAQFTALLDSKLNIKLLC